MCPPVPSFPGFVLASAEPASSRTTFGLRHFFFSNLLPLAGHNPEIGLLRVVDKSFNPLLFMIIHQACPFSHPPASEASFGRALRASRRPPIDDHKMIWLLPLIS